MILTVTISTAAPPPAIALFIILAAFIGTIFPVATSAFTGWYTAKGMSHMSRRAGILMGCAVGAGLTGLSYLVFLFDFAGALLCLIMSAILAPIFTYQLCVMVNHFRAREAF